ncbi:LOW QUALITY PROTEIN: hypothetical protein M8C21_031328, partial [Ambrosia artemisiifolia]
MDLVQDRTCIIEEGEEKEDRISNLPDDIIHCILSFLDLKEAIRTSTLSPKWEHKWKKIRDLNFNSGTFRTIIPSFWKFVEHALSHRSNDVDVSKVICPGGTSPIVLQIIVGYAYLHNASELNITSIIRGLRMFPTCLFSSHTLKHLTLATNDQSCYVGKCERILPAPWNFPALETVCLSGMHLDDDGDESLELFSKCVNLRDLTLHKCCMKDLKIFDICAPALSDLTITDAIAYPDVFNVVAPQLKNLTASIMATSNQDPSKFDCLQLSIEAFDSLEKVDLSLSVPEYKQLTFVPLLLNLFPKLHNTKFLAVNLDIIQALSIWSDKLSHEHCPFDNLKCLKINTKFRNLKDRITKIPPQVRNYLLENSPSATIM